MFNELAPGLLILSIMALAFLAAFVLMIACMTAVNMDKGYGFFESIKKSLDALDPVRKG
jgi:hypothetical protein